MALGFAIKNFSFPLKFWKNSTQLIIVGCCSLYFFILLIIRLSFKYKKSIFHVDIIIFLQEIENRGIMILGFPILIYLFIIIFILLALSLCIVIRITAPPLFLNLGISLLSSLLFFFGQLVLIRVCCFCNFNNRISFVGAYLFFFVLSSIIFFFWKIIITCSTFFFSKYLTYIHKEKSFYLLGFAWAVLAITCIRLLLCYSTILN